MMHTPLTSPQRATEYRAQALWTDETIYDRFVGAAAISPHKVAIVDGERRITYEDLSTLIDRVARSLLDLGIPQGATIGCQYKNSAELPIVHLAAHRIGCLYLPLHDTWREVEMRHLLRQAAASVLFIPGEYRGFDHRQMIEDIRADLPQLEYVFVMEGEPGSHKRYGELLAGRATDRSALDRRKPDPDAPAATMMSSGTTSLSKISRFSSNNFLAMFDRYVEAAEFDRDVVTAAIAPAGTGATGYVWPILGALLVGGTAVILPRWKDPQAAIDLIVKEKCTHATAIPTQLTLMVPFLEKRERTEFAAMKMLTNAGAPLSPATARRVEELMACKVQSLYGATDGGTPTMIAATDPAEKRVSTVGRPGRGVELQLWDGDGKPVAEGERGEVVWRSPDKSWGYLNDDDATHSAFTPEGFYKSGDLGELDADGYLMIVGRIKDMILRGGRNISPRTCEDLLINHPSVLDVAIAPMPDPILGERACAFVITRDGKTLTFDEMIAFLTNCKVATWQLPERLELMEDLPRSTGNKIAKAKLTEYVAKKLQAAAQK